MELIIVVIITTTIINVPTGSMFYYKLIMLIVVYNDELSFVCRHHALQWVYPDTIKLAKAQPSEGFFPLLKM